MSRIELKDNTMDVVMKMSDGNPGAMQAIMAMLTEGDQIDLDSVMGGLGAVLMLDTWEIYGTDIYVLYNDKCGRDMRKMLMLMRATQLGFFSHIKLQQMAADQTRQVNLSDVEMAELDAKVCEQLKGFEKAPEVEDG